MEGGELLVVGWDEQTAGAFGQKAGVVTGEGESDSGAGIGHDATQQGFGELAEVLMGQGQAHAETAGLGQGIAEVAGETEVVLHFVDVQHDRAATKRLQGGPTESGLPDQGHHHRAHELSGFGAERALGQIDQHHPWALPAVVSGTGSKQVGEVETGVALSEDGPQLWTQQDGAQFVQ